jgi:hypothetical protein
MLRRESADAPWVRARDSINGNAERISKRLFFVACGAPRAATDALESVFDVFGPSLATVSAFLDVVEAQVRAAVGARLVLAAMRYDACTTRPDAAMSTHVSP